MEARFNVDARVHDFRALVEEDVAQVEEFLKYCCKASGVGLVEEVWDHLLAAPGKRLRPILLLLAARAHGHVGSHTVMAGAVVEMIHTATLIHDDVVDKATVRRGQPTVNRRWHDGIALMMGDFLYSKGFQLFTAAGLQSEMAVLADTTNRMSVAEMMQFEYHTKLDMSEEEYLLLIREKTASLIEASCSLGALLAGADSVEPVSTYGNNVGLAFQITDDLLDYLGDEYVVGKPVGSDLRDGKVTLPLITALGNAPPSERRRIETEIRSGAIFEERWPQMVRFVHTHGGIEAALARARRFGSQAKRALLRLPSTPEREALADAVDFILHRCN
ncbi:MAG: polyprenyl synthetase family protein [Candidatus Latescibacterota bacterium]|nr:MAG: polyprenyl synthetase family protein [Candidatus Latescibacterota bacterium]